MLHNSSLHAVGAAHALVGELIARGVEEPVGAIGRDVAVGVVLGLLRALPETIIVIIVVLNSANDVALGSAIV